MLKQYLEKVMRKQDLKVEEAQTAMEIIMTGQATPAQIGGYLVALRMKGESVAEILGSARAMRAHVVCLPLSVNGDDLIDTAGTGGDGAQSFNISTTAAFIVAGTGQKVAKHGNRAASSQCGSADVLAALGLNLDLTPEQVAHCIEQIGIGFLFAPKFHPAMKHAIGPRRELGQRTIFNLLGPLTNPAGASYQLIGVYDAMWTHAMAEVLGELGGCGAYVVHGYGGLDELTTGGPNQVSYLSDGQVRTYQIDPDEWGLRPAKLSDLAGGEPQRNAQLLHDLLAGRDDSPRKDIVLFNAAAALATRHGDFRACLNSARQSLESGAAFEKLNTLVTFSQQVSL